jgi:hypothetical protein
MPTKIFLGGVLPQIIAAGLLLRGKQPSPASLAYHLGVSRARVTRVMNLLKLCPEVIEIVSDSGNKKNSRRDRMSLCVKLENASR